MKSFAANQHGTLVLKGEPRNGARFTVDQVPVHVVSTQLAEPVTIQQLVHVGADAEDEVWTPLILMGTPVQIGVTTRLTLAGQGVYRLDPEAVGALGEEDAISFHDDNGTPEKWDLLWEGLTMTGLEAPMENQPAYEPNFAVYSINPASQDIPTAYAPSLEYVEIEMDLTDGDYDLTPWLPTSAGEHVEFRFRKVDNSTNRITYTDADGVAYTFVDRLGEFITLVWDEADNRLHVV